ncbi:MAG TPA: heavy metal translocating P-type ATPase [Coriobacteriia bacterium]|jgi:Cd2+/Zn2+-exporting ATPase
MAQHDHTLKLPVLMPSPVYCVECVRRLREAVDGLAGVSFTEIDPGGGTLTVVHDTDVISDADLETTVRSLGLEVGGIAGHVAYRVSGLDCPDCAKSVDKSVAYLDGVLSADLNFASGVLVVEYDPAKDPRASVVDLIRKMGYGAEALGEEAGRAVAEFRIRGLDCPDCAAKLRDIIAGVSGVETAELDFNVARVRVGYDPRRIEPDDLAKAIGAAGYVPELVTEGRTGAAAGRAWWSTYRHELSTAACGVLLVLGTALVYFGSRGAWDPSVFAFLGAILAGGWITARRAVASLRARSLDMNVLMTVAVIGATAIGDWREGATVVFLFALGGLLESRSLARTRRSIRDLMQLAPERARVRRGGADIELPPDEAIVGDLLVVKPGERIALDGEVVRGASAVDESPITGESVPAEKDVGDTVYAGTLNTSGLLEVRVESLASDSTLARVIYLVEEAQARRAPMQRLVDRFTKYYTPAVVGLAVAVAAVPPVLGLGSFAVWFYRALVLLVISCPCALVISTPVAIVSAITRATRDGVLVKGGAFLEIAPKVRAVAFDKTGTLTLGRPAVVGVVPLDSMPTEEIVCLAAMLETGSTHPIAGALVRAAEDACSAASLASMSDYRDVAGKGVTARIGGTAYAVGSAAFARETGALRDGAEGRIAEMEQRGETVLVLSRENEAVGLVGVSDEIRPDARETVRRLRRAGIEHVVMLTGDNERTARAVAERAGVTEVRARLLPAGKVDAVRELRERYGSVAMVGDGVNDAPALAASDLGVAMGAAGSDTALETADVALLADDLRALPGFFALGKRTVRNVTQNVAFSVIVKLAVLLLAVFGRATLWMAVFADTGVALLVILNGLRLLRAPSRA